LASFTSDKEWVAASAVAVGWRALLVPPGTACAGTFHVAGMSPRCPATQPALARARKDATDG